MRVLIFALFIIMFTKTVYLNYILRTWTWGSRSQTDNVTLLKDTSYCWTALRCKLILQCLIKWAQLYCFVVPLLPSESRGVQDGKRVSRGKTYNDDSCSAQHQHREEEMHFMSLLSLKTIQTHIFMLMSHSTICSHCEISPLLLGRVDNIADQIQFAIKIAGSLRDTFNTKI